MPPPPCWAQVLQESLHCLAQRYLLLAPSPQRLPRFVADVLHAATTAFLLCQPIAVVGAAVKAEQQQQQQHGKPGSMRSDSTASSSMGTSTSEGAAPASGGALAAAGGGAPDVERQIQVRVLALLAAGNHADVSGSLQRRLTCPPGGAWGG